MDVGSCRTLSGPVAEFGGQQLREYDSRNLFDVWSLIMAQVMRLRSSRRAYLQLMRELAPLRHLFLMGGFAEDALLDHKITRDRSDLDLLVEFDLWNMVLTQLHGVGIARFEPLFSGPAGNPLAFGSIDRGFKVEVWLTTRLTDGYAIVLPGEASIKGSSFFRLRLPADTFQFPNTTLEGVFVQTISPLALSLLRATSAQTRGDSQKRAEDLKVLERLARKFLLRRDPTDLIPEITELRVGARSSQNQ